MENKYVVAVKCGNDWMYAGYQRDHMENLYATFVDEDRSMDFSSAENAKNWYRSVHIKNVPENCHMSTLCVQEKKVKYEYNVVEII